MQKEPSLGGDRHPIGSQAAEWMEANAVITDSQGLDFLRKRFNIEIVGRPITHSDLSAAERAWNARKRVVTPGRRSLMHWSMILSGSASKTSISRLLLIATQAL